MAEDLATIAADVWGTPTQLTFSAETVTAIVSASSREKQMEDAGYLLQYDLTAVCSKADFTTEPVENNTVTVSSVNYRVQRLDDDGTALTMQLRRIN